MAETSADSRSRNSVPQSGKNYYRILHVQPDAPAEIIRSSYLTLMQELKQHPDLGGEHWNATLINEAHVTLMNPAKRASYDEKLLADRAEPATKRSSAGARKKATGTRSRRAGYEPKVRYYCSFCKTPQSDSAMSFPESECADCGSPLFPASKLVINSSDRRSVERIPKQQRVRFYTNWPQAMHHSGETRDISVNGLRFATSTRVSNGQFLKLECGVCRAVARVTNCTEAGADAPGWWLVGAEFVTLRFEGSRGVFVSAEV